MFRDYVLMMMILMEVTRLFDECIMERVLVFCLTLVRTGSWGLRCQVSSLALIETWSLLSLVLIFIINGV
jgi:hypothetical protein